MRFAVAIVSANAYLGAAGIVDALGQGARIVVTGRVADASLTLAPAVYEFGWNWSDWNRLAAATVAGHLIECGAQCTGGMFSAWRPEIRFRTSVIRSPRSPTTAAWRSRRPRGAVAASRSRRWPSNSCTKSAIRPTI